MAEPAWWAKSFEALSRRKVFRTGAAYAVVAWLSVQVADTVLPAFDFPQSSMRILIIALVAGFPVALVFGWLYDVRRDGIHRTRTPEAVTPRARYLDFVIIGLLAVAVGYLLVDRLRAPDPPPVSVTAPAPAPATAAVAPGASVAVLPFENLSTDPNNEMFADGLAEDVLIRLAKIESLRVPGRTSSFKYKGVRDDIAEIARALNVSAILEGTVQAYETTIKVTARLINAHDGFEMWSARYTRELTDVFAIQEQIARDVAHNLEIELVGNADDPVARPTDNLDAYRLYLRGRIEWHKRTSSSLQDALTYFQQAIELDPTFALAWSGLADTYKFSAQYGNMSQTESIDLADAAARKALELDPELPEAHASLGLVRTDQARLREAVEAFQRAVDLNPGYANAHMWLGGVLWWVDRDAALEERRKAAELEPLSPIAIHLYGETLRHNGRLDEARRQFLKVVDFAPEYPLVYFELANLDLRENDFAGALRALRKANELDPGRAATHTAIADVYLTLGDLATAGAWLDRAQAIGPDQISVITSRLMLMYVSGDHAGMETVIEDQLSDSDNFFGNFLFRSLIAYEQENYADSARWMQDLFDRFAARQDTGSENAPMPLNDETMFGVLFLASALNRGDDPQGGKALARRLMAFVDEMAASGLTKGDHLLVRAGSQIVLGDPDSALVTLRRMADRGYPGYLTVEGSRLFLPLRNELQFQVSIDNMRKNAQTHLAAVSEI